MADDLFSFADEPRRQRLKDLGCFEAVGTDARGCLHWRLPDGAVVTETEAFLWLDRQEGSVNDGD